MSISIITGPSVNARDAAGSSPLHTAAECNEPRAAQYLLKHSAFVDAADAEGRTALMIAEALRWKEMQRVLRDPAILFWNRAARANKLYKAKDFEPACEGYEAAQLELERMPSAPSAENVATFYFNYARSSQLMGRLTRGAELFDKVLAAAPKHLRALDHRAECHNSLQDYDAVVTGLAELTKAHGATADAPARQSWARRTADAKAQLKLTPREVLGLPPTAGEAEIRKAYRQACLQHHPDKHASSSLDLQTRSRHKFGRIQAAIDKLSAAPKRSAGFSRTHSAGFGGFGFE